MNSEIHFVNGNLVVPAILLGALLLTIFIWKDWKGSFNRSFFVNVMLATISVFSIVIMVLTPSVLKESTSKGLLLTDGYDKEKLDSLKKDIRSLKIVKYQKGNNLRQKLDSLSEVMILGQGIPRFDFWQLEGHEVEYLKNDFPEGIIQLKYDQELVEGDEIKANGVFNRPNTGHQLILKGIGGVILDSIKLDGGSSQSFELKSKVDVPGKYVFKLIEKDSTGQEVSVEKLPVIVKEKEVLRILISNGFPSFETKYLKNFLAEAGHEVVVRNQITQQKFKFEYFNTEKRSVYGFLSEILQNFDLLILDANSYLTLSRKSRRAVIETVREKGLGVFVQPDEKLFGRSNKFEGTKIIPDKITKARIENWSKLKLEKYPYQFSDDIVLNGTVLNDDIYFEFKGVGKIGTTLLNNTYQLVLNGNTKEYRQIWSQIINMLSKRRMQIGEMDSPQLFSFQNEPYPFWLETTLEKPKVVHQDGYKIPLMQDMVNHRLYESITYPVHLGWNSISMEVDSSITHHYYVLDTIDWKPLRAYETIRSNQKHFKSNTETVKKNKIYHPISRLWFFFSFLFAMGLLWLLPKWNG